VVHGFDNDQSADELKVGIALQEWLDNLSNLGNGGHYLGRISLTMFIETIDLPFEIGVHGSAEFCRRQISVSSTNNFSGEISSLLDLAETRTSGINLVAIKQLYII